MTLQFLFHPDKRTGLVHDTSLAILKEKGSNERVSDLYGKNMVLSVAAWVIRYSAMIC